MEKLNFDKTFDEVWKLETKPNFKEFQNRVVNVLMDREIIFGGFSSIDMQNVCQSLGISYYYQMDWHAIVRTLLEESDEREFLRRVSKIITYFPKFITGIRQAIELSSCHYRLYKINNFVLIAPVGEPKLDEELLRPLFSFLDDKSSMHVGRAFALMLEKKYVEAGESLRRGLEEFLRYQLGNSKHLKENIIELGKLLKIDKVDVSIRKIAQTVLSYVDTWFNENTKHHSTNVSKNDIQWLVYQVAVLMHFINGELSN